MHNSRLKRVEQTVGIVALLLMFVIICCNVVMRYVFSEPLYWAEEASNYLFVWIGFLSCANSVAEGTHIRVTAFVDLLGERAKSWLAFGLDGLLLVTFAAYIIPSWRALDSLHISTGLQINEKYPYAIIPITMVLCFIHVLLRVVGELRIKVKQLQGQTS